MKTKTLLLVGLCAISLCSWEAQAVNTKPIPINKTEISDPPQGYEKIELKGSLIMANIIICFFSNLSVFSLFLLFIFI